MERGKRASMREGPLAALFRKTEEEGLGENQGADSEGGPRTADRGPERSEFGQVPAQQEPRVGKPHPSTDASSSPLDDRDPRLEELRPAPPSARHVAEPARPEPEPEPRERRVRSPEQRLRDVFSTHIPENIMELSPTTPVAVEREQPRYGREEPRVPMST